MAAIDPGNRIYFDSNIFIYAFENSPTFQRSAQAMFQRAADGQAQIFVSELVFPEILPKPLRDGKSEIAEQYLSFLQNTAGIELIPIDTAIVMLSVELRALYNLKTADALHVATAIRAECTSFISVDKALKRVKEIPVISLRDDNLTT